MSTTDDDYSSPDDPLLGTKSQSLTNNPYPRNFSSNNGTFCMSLTSIILAILSSYFFVVGSLGSTQPCPNASISSGMYTESISLMLFASGLLVMACSATTGRGGPSGAIFACTSCLSIILFIVGATLISVEKHKTGCDLFAKESVCTTSCTQLWMGVKIWFYLLLTLGALLVIFIFLNVCCGKTKEAPSLMSAWEVFDKKQSSSSSSMETQEQGGGGPISRPNAQMSF